MFGLCFLFL